MIRVEIPRKELLRQLPEQAGSALMQWFDQLPATFFFDALPEKEDWAPAYEAHPELWKLTFLEGKLFQTLYRRGKVSYMTIWSILSFRDRSPNPSSNNISVHTKNLRKKIKMYNLPFDIKTHRATWGSDGGFLELIEL